MSEKALLGADHLLRILKAKRCWRIQAVVVAAMVLSIGVLITRYSYLEVSGLQAEHSGASSRQKPAVCRSSSQSVRRVLIVGSDGMRADTLENLDHPIIQELTAIGFYTRGRTQTNSHGSNIEHGTNENIPAIVSGKPLHDIYGTKTGLLAEGYTGRGYPIPSNVETLFEVGTRQGFYTGFIYGKTKAKRIVNPANHKVDYVWGTNSRDDSQVRKAAIEFLKANAHRKWYLLVWFSEPDYVQVGISDKYRNAVARNLDFLAAIIETMKATCTYQDSIIALTADHGMSDNNGHHGKKYWNDPRVYEVPWLVAAPGFELVHKGRGTHYNHEISATVSALAWGVLPTNSDSTVWLDRRQIDDEYVVRRGATSPSLGNLHMPGM